MNFDLEMRKKTIEIETGLKEYLEIKYPEIIYEAMNYSVMAGGKRLRPVLLLSACEFSGGKAQSALPFACAMEMIHTYSLIHDDLPAMDNDDYRRGKLTNHKVFGEAVAILAGDGLLNLAYEIMSERCQNSFDLNNVKAMSVIAKAAGVCGMIGGQTVDMEYENKIARESALLYIHKNKTGKLIQAALTAGAILGNADSKAFDIFSGLGEKLGLAFQIQDDLLDVTGDFEKLGKNTNCDAKNNKTTYISVYGLEKAKSDYLSLSGEITDLVKSLGGDNQFLLEFTQSLINRER